MNGVEGGSTLLACELSREIQHFFVFILYLRATTSAL